MKLRRRVRRAIDRPGYLAQVLYLGGVVTILGLYGLAYGPRVLGAGIFILGLALVLLSIRRLRRK